ARETRLEPALLRVAEQRARRVQGGQAGRRGGRRQLRGEGRQLGAQQIAEARGGGGRVRAPRGGAGARPGRARGGGGACVGGAEGACVEHEDLEVAAPAERAVDRAAGLRPHGHVLVEGLHGGGAHGRLEVARGVPGGQLAVVPAGDQRRRAQQRAQ